MSKKTITVRVRRCKNDELRIKIIVGWISDWKREQTSLCKRLSSAVKIHDFDEACIVNGQLRAITYKKFTALNNIFQAINMLEQTGPEGEIYKWCKTQTALIAAMGKHIAYYEWEDVSAINRKLISINQVKFRMVEQIITIFEENPIVVSESEEQPLLLSVSNSKASKPVAKLKKESVNIGEIIETYYKTDSLKVTAAIYNIGWQKVRKILITAGKYENDITQKIAELRKIGLSNDEIALRLHISKTVLNNYLPYECGPYNMDQPTVNALRIRKYRELSKKNNLDTPGYSE